PSKTTCDFLPKVPSCVLRKSYTLTGPMTIFTDALYRPIEIKRTPQRIVSLVPSITEALFTFGLGDAVVGVTRFCVEPREAVAPKAKVGGTKRLTSFRCDSSNPTLSSPTSKRTGRRTCVS